MSDFVRFAPPLEEDEERERTRKAIPKTTVGTTKWGSL